MTKATQDLPEWGKMPTKPGLYLSLCHGRAFPQEPLKQRGFAGPKIGPLLYVRTEYAQQVTLRFANKRDAARFFPDATTTINMMQIVEGTLVFDQKCYGNWDICYVAAEFCLKKASR